MPEIVKFELRDSSYTERHKLFVVTVNDEEVSRSFLRPDQVDPVRRYVAEFEHHCRTVAFLKETILTRDKEIGRLSSRIAGLELQLNDIL